MRGSSPRSRGRLPWFFRITSSLGQLLQQSGRGCLYAGAGTLRRRQLQSLSSQWRNTGTDAVRTAPIGFKPWERDIYDRFVRPRDRVLIVGSGTGRGATAFGRAGHDVVGVEPAAKAVAFARRRCAEHQIDAAFLEGHLENLALPGTFDLVVFSGFTYGAIPESARRIDALTCLVPHLRPNARVVISYVSPSAPLRTYAVRLGQLTAALSGSDWHPEPNDVLRVSDGLLRFDHWFTPDEIAREVRRAGFQIAFDTSPADRPTTLVLTRGESS